MNQKMTGCKDILLEFSDLVASGKFNKWSGNLRTGVDLGTANIVLSVVDENNQPIAGATYPSKVVRDGIVVDYIGAIKTVSRLKEQLENLLGTTLNNGACAIPPGIMPGNVKAIGNVVEGAGFRLTNVVDEPTAAASVLSIRDGAVVDVGGGTTGISILKDGEVIFTGDEPTGGTHMTLTLAGAYRLAIEDAEAMKCDASQEDKVFPVIIPVVEKMASIVQRYMTGYSVNEIYVVGGACCFSQFESVFEKFLGVKTIKPIAPLLVTPLGIALNCKD